QNTTQNQQTIYVRVTNISTTCFNTVSFDLIVNPLPVNSPISDLVLCDTDTDGLVQNIDLSLQTQNIIDGQSPGDYSVSYYTSLNDAQNNTNPIVGPFTNTTPFSQTIYVRITNNTTGCFSTDSQFDIIVNPEPFANRINDLEFCDNDLDGDDTNGFIQDINFENLAASILGPSQDPNDFQVTFYETLDDANTTSNPITFPYSNSTANVQEIFVRVDNNNTGCFNTRVSFQLNINPLPEFEVTSPQYICLGDTGLLLEVENPTELYDYFWVDANGNTVLGETITATQAGTYSVTATKLDGTGCSRTRDIVVIASSVATITEEDVIIDDGDSDNSILINNNNGNLGIGDYEFALLDSENNIVYNYQDEPFFDNLPGGIYTILVRDKNGCGEAELEVAVIELPKFFTPNDDGVNDTWNVKGVNTDFFPKSRISVFDRFGKPIAQFSIDHPGWNGRYNGRVVISNDYWVRVELTDRNGKVRVETQNFALLRR
ncbi:T9SS type B sorting domain-containing protein, partial [Pseudotenacibaculum haliotis]